MSRYDPNEQDLDDLLRQVDSLLDEDQEDEDWSAEEASQEQDINIDEYAPADTREDPIFYQNYSNDYGRQVRNYQNGYGGRSAAPQPPQSAPAEPTIPAYNADFRQPRRERNTQSQAYKAQQKREHRSAVQRTDRQDTSRAQPPQTFSEPAPPRSQPRQTQYYSYDQPQSAPKPAKVKKPRGGCCGCGCTTMLIALVLMVVLVIGLVNWAFQMPQADVSIGERKDDTATILICGTDEDGTRTDTMMLLYLSGSEKSVGLLSLPRDTYTIATAGYAAKLNSAYGRNDCGEQGMEALLDYVQDIIGYRPDGYILVDFTLVPQIVDLMGGVEVDVPVSFDDTIVQLEAGLQTLNGTEVLSLLRHRSSYATADLGRVEVQREVIKACMDQWISLSHLKDVGAALDLVENNSISNLSTRNYLWISKTILTSLSNGFSTETLPGYADYIDGQSFYILDRNAVAEMINQSYNPYDVTILPGELNIAG